MLEGARKLAQTLSLAELLPDDAEVKPAISPVTYCILVSCFSALLHKRCSQACALTMIRS